MCRTMIADSESTYKVTSIGKFLGWMSFLWRAVHQILILGENYAFAVGEQLHRFQTKPTPVSDSPLSKVPHTIWNRFFWIVRAPLILMYMLRWMIVDDKIKQKVSGAYTIKKNEIHNSMCTYFRPWWIWIRGRFGPEQMQLFVNGKNTIFDKIRIWCTALHKNRHSHQKFHIYIILYVDSEFIIKNMISLQNLEIHF